MIAVGVLQFFLVDEKDKPQQSMTIHDTGATISGHKITHALICVDFASRRAGSKYDRLWLIVIRKTLELTRAFSTLQDEISSIDCFFEKVTARKTSKSRFVQLRTMF